MAEYWLKASADAQAEGPLSAAEVKRRAADGSVARQTLISMDNITFHAAGRVKGLFPARAHATTETASVATATVRTPRPGGMPPTYPGSFRTVVRSVPVTPPPQPDTEPTPTNHNGLASEAPSPIIDAAVSDTTEPPPAHDATGADTSESPPAPPQQEIGDGTIETQPPMPIHTPATAAPPPLAPPPLAPATSPQARPALPPALAYATPGVTGQGMIAPRRTGGFFATAVLMLIAGVVQMYGFYVSYMARPTDAQFFIHVSASLCWLGLAVVALVMWLTWLSGVHRDIRVLTGGQYGISPAKASGFLFIPIFNAFWTVFAPAKLAGALNMQLRAANEAPVSRGGVVLCQAISVVAPLIGLYPISPLMYAMSMRMIQGGFNRLVKLQYAR